VGSLVRKQGRLRCLFCAGAILLNATTPAHGEEYSPNVKKLVDESTKKRGVRQSRLLNENPLVERDLPEVLAFIKKHPDYTSYYLLMALKRYYPASYKDVSNADKAAILCSALKTSEFLNDWGTLEPYGADDTSAKALLEVGKEALGALRPILDDATEAPLFGSKVATASVVYQYRRKDFAYRYVSLILGESPVFDRDPKARDKAIEALKAKLKKDDK
jgi:hypothetical protein